MRSMPEFLIVALLVTLTPGPGTATIIRVAARDGRAAALRAVAGNSAGVLLWGTLSAAGVSSLILASEVAYDVLRIGGAGLITSVSNPKLAVFFVALFPQFLSPHAAVLPAALAMAAVVVSFDLLWFSALTYAVGRAKALLKPRVQRIMERFTGAVLVGLGVRLAAESR